MEKPVELKAEGLAIVKMGFRNSLEARNFLAQIGHLTSYGGPTSQAVVFCIDQDSLKQAFEWGLSKKKIRAKLLEYCEDNPRNHLKKWFRKINQRGISSSKEPGRYRRWLTRHPGFWSKLRIVQTFWVLRGFGKPINPTSLPEGLLGAIYRNRETWADLASYAGFDPEQEALLRRMGGAWTKEKVVERLRDLKRQGLPINTAWLHTRGYGGLLSALRRYFGSWETAVLAAGFDPQKEWEGLPARLTAEEVVAAILKRQILGQPLNPEAIRQKELNLHTSAKLYFGSWDNALAQAGINPLTIRQRSWSKETIVSALQEIKSREEPLHAKYLRNHYRKLGWAMRRHFGSWQRALRAAGFEPDKECRNQSWSRRKVLEQLKHLKRQGKPIYQGYLQSEYSKLDYAIRRYFGSWGEAVEAAGLDPQKESPRPQRLKGERKSA